MNASTRTLTSARVRIAYMFAILCLAVALPVKAFAQISIVIDPGHGGKDPGAMGPGTMEKKTNLAISQAVAREARRQGWKVMMTRNNDRFIPLTARPALANRTKASVFVAIHSNSTGNKALGNETIYRGAQGKRLGDAIMRQIAPMTPGKDLGNRSDVRGLAVLRAAKRTAVLVEIMSVTAPSERWQLNNAGMQQRYAQAIVRGIANYQHVPYKAAKPRPVRRPAAKPHANKPVQHKADDRNKAPKHDNELATAPWLLTEAAKAFRKANIPTVLAPILAGTGDRS